MIRSVSLKGSIEAVPQQSPWLEAMILVEKLYAFMLYITVVSEYFHSLNCNVYLTLHKISFLEMYNRLLMWHAL